MTASRYAGVLKAPSQRSSTDEGRVSVTYANGSAEVQKGGFLFFGSSPKPGPGSTVFVPRKDPSEEGFDVGQFVTGLVSVLASLTTVIVVLAR